MVSKRTLVLAAVSAVVVLGAVATAYACATCGCSAAETTKVAATAPFTVHDVTGPAKGQDLCYICRYGGRPQFVVFTRTTDGHIRHLAPEIQKVVTANKEKGVGAFIVLLADNTKANRDKLTALAKDLNLTIPLTIAADGAKGPKGYTLPEGFDTHVLVAHRNKVQHTITVNCSKETCGCTKCAKVADVLHAGKHLLASS